jgi:hypothetical protein
VSCSAQNESYPSPNGSSGPLVPIELLLQFDFGHQTLKPSIFGHQTIKIVKFENPDVLMSVFIFYLQFSPFILKWLLHLAIPPI